MTGFKVDVEGIGEALAALDNLGAVGKRNANKAIYKTAERVRSDAIRSIQSHQSKGVTYELSNPNRTHTASTAGNPPNTDTGELVRSIVAIKGPGPTAAVGTALRKGFWLEFGTHGIDPRPWLHPALERNIQGLIDNVTTALQDSISEVAK